MDNHICRFTRDVPPHEPYVNQELLDITSNICPDCGTQWIIKDGKRIKKTDE